MPRFLYLMRHAQSAEKQPGQKDIERVLTNAGMKQAARTGSFLLEQKLIPDQVLCSSAERAKATAIIVLDTLKQNTEKLVFSDDLYEASTRTFFHYITQLDNNLQQVLCVAHNPAITYLAEYLTKAEINEMLPGAIAIIQFPGDGWHEIGEGNGKLIHFFEPQETTG